MIYWGIVSPSDTSLHCPWSLLHTRSSSCAPWKWFQEIFHFGQSKTHPAEEKKRTSQTDAGRWSQTSLFHYTAPPVRITWYTCEDSRDRTKKKKIKSRFKILLPWACRAPCADSGSGFYKHPSPGQESPPEPGWLVWCKIYCKNEPMKVRPCHDLSSRTSWFSPSWPGCPRGTLHSQWSLKSESWKSVKFFSKTFSSCSSGRTSSHIWKSVTLPCVDIIGVVPVLWTHLQQ